MSNRAAIVTGASRGIGRAIAEALGEDGYDLTIVARKPESLEQAAAELRGRGFNVEAVAANLAHADAVAEVVEAHRSRFGRLDVLVNNAGVGVGAGAGEHEPKLIDMQLSVNLVAPVLFYRHALGMLRAAAAEHGSAVVVNMSSISAVMSPPWLSVYGASKAAVIAYTRSMNKELAPEGIKSVALAPGFVDTDMADFIKDEIPAAEMLPVSDVVEAVRFVLALSPNCVVPEIVLGRRNETGL
jgi:NAD(P)-dependent dehydrogenase (short-subunit alcohol dehydrogenase family)